MNDDVERVRARVDLVELVGQRVALKKAGRHWKGLCPFHEDRNPSLYVSPDTGWYKCWACGASGDAFKWVMETQKVDFREALETLAKEAGVDLAVKGARTSRTEAQLQAMEDSAEYFRSELARSPSARAYCQGRGLDDEVLAQWEIGYAPDVGDALGSYLQRKGHSLLECKSLFLVDSDAQGGYYDRFRGRLMFPIRDERGRLVGFGGRILGGGHPKYVNSGDTPLYSKSRVLYGLHRAKRAIADTQKAVLVEGYLDAIACHRAGVSNAVACLGTSLAEDHAKLLARWAKEVVLLYDADEAGQRAVQRAHEVLVAARLRVRVANLEPGQDPDTLLAADGPEAVRRAAEGGMSPTGFRILRIRQKLGPDQEEFWVEVCDALARCRNNLEIERHLQELAPLYPGLRDPTAARKALKEMVLAKRPEPAPARSPRTRAPKGVEEDDIQHLRLSGLEIAVFSALLEPSLTKQAWSVCQRLELFTTGGALIIARAVCQTYPEHPPEDGCVALFANLQDESARDDLMSIQLSARRKVDSTSLSAAVGELERKHKERELMGEKGQADDEFLRSYAQRVRTLRERNDRP